MPGKIFAIGDVHGCADELEELLEQLPSSEDSTIVMLGDYIDRGPASRRVIDVVMKTKEKRRLVTLVGNHEEMFLEFLDGSDPGKVARFVLNGGSRTLANYADKHGDYVIPRSHVDFLKGLDLWYETDDYFFVHAGVPDRSLKDLDPVKDREELLWIRRSFIHSTHIWEKRVVHGHTPVNAVEMSATRINIDTACAYGGFLTAVELPAHRIYSVPRKVEERPAFLRDRASRRAAIRFLGSVPVRVTHPSHGEIQMETLNYSEIGMLIRARNEAQRGEALLSASTDVEGIVGEGDAFSLPFKGRVVHAHEHGDGWEYGMEVELLG